LLQDESDNASEASETQVAPEASEPYAAFAPEASDVTD